ncbi:MAG: hypothetical protein QM775_08730 [Pirellulales bacterium]
MLQFEKQVLDNPTYYYHSTALKDREFEADIAEAWKVTCRHIGECREHGTWNRLVFECWYAEGRIVAYPHNRGDSPDNRRPTIDISISIHDDLRNKLDETNDESEQLSLIALTYTKLRNALRSTYRREPALTELKTLLKDNDFTCWTMENDSLDSMMKIDIYF